jgi:thymidine phosphorylase
VANGAGLKTTALLTDMDHPLASAAGNGVEMQNAVDFLTGKHIDARLWRVTVALGAEMLVSGGIASNAADGAVQMEAALRSGRAAERFAKMVSALGGPKDFVEKAANYLPRPPVEMAVNANAQVRETCKDRLAFDTRELGLAVIELGGGRTRPQDPIDHAVGLVEIAQRDWDGRSPLCRILARDEASARRAMNRIIKAAKPGRRTPAAIMSRIG